MKAYSSYQSAARGDDDEGAASLDTANRRDARGLPGKGKGGQANEKHDSSCLSTAYDASLLRSSFRLSGASSHVATTLELEEFQEAYATL